MHDITARTVQAQVDMFVERRIAGSKEEREHVKGEMEAKVKPQKI